MTKLFRKIRQNLISGSKTGNYLKYAAGEIVLVVFGILIALSINNWNEGRKNDKREALLIKNIIEDLNSDTIHMNQAIEELQEQLDVVDSLIAKAINPALILNYNNMGLVRYSSDFRPKSKRNHAQAVSNLENKFIREALQNYFFEEDQVVDIFLEYEKIIHNEIRPYLRSSGMHDLNSLYLRGSSRLTPKMLQPKILDKELADVKFQQVLFERRLKTSSFQGLLNELKISNQELVKILSSDNK